ncbi:glycoside hydrolase domain-containing protein [Nakamurella alba]|uniref:glycoside hydrolase domain-containing protein n=1 Tax=Nakamurella alba TaxID=2665158 RepID=UPI001E53BFD5|nr:glycoside hydrolase domain-containing protein [Nakamurella alba]
MRLSRSLAPALILALAASALLAVSSASTAAAYPVPTAVVTTVPAGAKSFDNISADSESVLRCLQTHAFTHDVVDVNTGADDKVRAGWEDEYSTALGLGYSVSLFQGYLTSAWKTPARGTTRANAVVGAAKAQGYPAGATIFLNVEDTKIAGQTSVQNRATIIQWIRNWTKVVAAAGYKPGLYIGVPQALTAADIANVGAQVFWRSASSSAPQAAQGFVIQQSAAQFDITLCGTRIDVDTTSTDNRGNNLTGAVRPRPGVAGMYGVIPTARFYDSGVQLAPGATATVKVLGRGTVPTSGVSAVAVNTSAIGATSTGYLTVYPAGTARPSISSMQVPAGRTVSNLSITRPGSGGAVNVYNGTGSAVRVVLDVQGYYVGGATAHPGAFTPIAPGRFLDSGATVAPGTAVTVKMAGRGGIPATGAGTVAINLTAVSPASSGYLTVYPTGSNRPAASSMQFGAGQSRSALSLVRTGTDGSITVFNGSAGAVRIIVDGQGWYRAGAGTRVGSFTPIAPVRFLDTGTSLTAGASVTVRIAGRGGVPATGASVAAVNVTAVNPGVTGYLTVYPAGTSRPATSTMQFWSGASSAGQILVPIGANGSVTLFNGSGGTVRVVLDVQGYSR